jgi:hypothetical protein
MHDDKLVAMTVINFVEWYPRAAHPRRIARRRQTMASANAHICGCFNSACHRPKSPGLGRDEVRYFWLAG